jgi:hypothetical protein
VKSGRRIAPRGGALAWAMTFAAISVSILRGASTCLATSRICSPSTGVDRFCAGTSRRSARAGALERRHPNRLDHFEMTRLLVLGHLPHGAEGLGSYEVQGPADAIQLETARPDQFL